MTGPAEFADAAVGLGELLVELTVLGDGLEVPGAEELEDGLVEGRGGRSLVGGVLAGQRVVRPLEGIAAALPG